MPVVITKLESGYRISSYNTDTEAGTETELLKSISHIDFSSPMDAVVRALEINENYMDWLIIRNVRDF